MNAATHPTQRPVTVALEYLRGIRQQTRMTGMDERWLEKHDPKVARPPTKQGKRR
jgi:hypothetical protein